MPRPRNPNSPLDEIVQLLDNLSPEELRELQSMLEALLASKSELADTDEPEASDPGVHRGPKGGKGHVEVKLIPDTKRGKTYGPYRYLRYWQEGKLRTRYLGKEDS